MSIAFIYMSFLFGTSLVPVKDKGDIAQSGSMVTLASESDTDGAMTIRSSHVSQLTHNAPFEDTAEPVKKSQSLLKARSTYS